VEGDGGEVRKEKIAARRHGKTGELFFFLRSRMGLGLELGLKEELCGLDWTGLGWADQTGQTKRLGVGGRVRGPERTGVNQV